MDIKYIEFKQEIVKATENEISQNYGPEWNILRLGKSSNWLVTRQSDILVNGKSYRDFVLKYYDTSKLSAKIFEKFKKDLAKGRIKLF